MNCDKLKKGTSRYKKCISEERESKKSKAVKDLYRLSGIGVGMEGGSPRLSLGNVGSIRADIGRGFGVTGRYAKRPEGRGFAGGDYDYEIELSKKFELMDLFKKR